MPKRHHRRAGDLRGTQLLQRLVNDARASFDAWHIPEPKLIFAAGHTNEDPKTGIELYGPAALDKSPREAIRVGVIGTGDTIQQFRNWADAARRRIRAGTNARGRPYDPIICPDFPGLDQDSPFRCRIDVTATETLTESAIANATANDSYPSRVDTTVNLVAERIAVMARKEPSPDVIVCAMPTAVEDSCGVAGRIGKRKTKLAPIEKAERIRKRESDRTGQKMLVFGEESERSVEAANGTCWDFHNALKARAMKYGIPTQLLWEGTASGKRGTQDPATTAWNFFTALYYKSGNVPWELGFSTARTCFVGVTFYRESADPDAPTRTCLAQAFSETGEGLVLIGERVTWDTSRDKKPHLSQNSAARLLDRVLEMYKQHFDGPPVRVVVHKSSRFWPEELQGFKSALKDVHSFDFLAIERRGIRFLRLGLNQANSARYFSSRF